MFRPLSRRAIVKDEKVCERMIYHIGTAEQGISRDTQLRALTLLKVVAEGDGKQIFNFAHEILKDRWEKLSHISITKHLASKEFQLCIAHFLIDPENHLQCSTLCKEGEVCSSCCQVHSSESSRLESLAGVLRHIFAVEVLSKSMAICLHIWLGNGGELTKVVTFE